MAGWDPGREREEDPEATALEASPEELEGIRASLKNRPKPTSPQVYDVEEAAFWENCYLPVGSVITYEHVDHVTNPMGIVAILVKEQESRVNGMWLKVKWLGTDVLLRRRGT